MPKKKIAYLGITLVAMLCPSMLYASAIGTVNTQVLNIRKNPTTSSEVVAKVSYGDQLKMLSMNEEYMGWYQVQLANKETAYVKDEFLTVTRILGTINTNQLNFRSYPSLSTSQILGQLPLGAEVTVIYQVGDFYKVGYQGITGFVYAPYVDVTFGEYITQQDLAGVQDILLNKDVDDMKEIIETLQQATLNHKVQQEQTVDNQESVIVQTPLEGTPISEQVGRDIVGYGLQFVGNPYVYAGNDLNTGVDCSGFTQQVMKHFNIRIPRTSKAQSKMGMRITDTSALQPGDLLFFGSSEEDINHVAIYIEDDMMVHSSTPETGIIISEMTERGFSTLQVMRRMVVN